MTADHIIPADLMQCSVAELAAEVVRLRAANQELVLQVLATDGQAQEALDRATKAEARAERMRLALQSAQESIAAFIGVHGYPIDSGAGDVLSEVTAALNDGGAQ